MADVHLQVVASESEFGDTRLAGEWAAVLPEMLASNQVAPWCSYAARVANRLVGYGAFKGEPSSTGEVEIAYLTFIPDRGRGLATEICAELVRIAIANNASAIIAHTQPETGPSTAILESQRFDFIGEVSDPDDGLVWRWERR